MGEELELLISGLLANVLAEHRNLLRQALYEAISMSESTRLYIPYVMRSPDFKIVVDTATKIPSAIAEYQADSNTLIIFKNANYWRVADFSDISRILLHEFMHGYFAILHAPNGAPHKHRRSDRVLLARPLAPLDNREQIYDQLLQALYFDLRDLIKIVTRFLVDRRGFAQQYPKLSEYLEKLAEQYVPKIEMHLLPPLQPGESCDTKYEDVFKGIKDFGAVTQIIEGSPRIIRSLYGRGPGLCGALDHVGDVKWDRVSRNLFELYWYITSNLLRQDKFDSDKRRYLNWYIEDHQYNYQMSPNAQQLAKMDLDAKELGFGEWIARISEIGPFFQLLQRTLPMLADDYKTYVLSRKNAFNRVIKLPPK